MTNSYNEVIFVLWTFLYLIVYFFLWVRQLNIHRDRVFNNSNNPENFPFIAYHPIGLMVVISTSVLAVVRNSDSLIYLIHWKIIGLVGIQIFSILSLLISQREKISFLPLYAMMAMFGWNIQTGLFKIYPQKIDIIIELNNELEETTKEIEDFQSALRKRLNTISKNAQELNKQIKEKEVQIDNISKTLESKQLDLIDKQAELNRVKRNLEQGREKFNDWIVDYEDSDGWSNRDWFDWWIPILISVFFSGFIIKEGVKYIRFKFLKGKNN